MTEGEPLTGESQSYKKTLQKVMWWGQTVWSSPTELNPMFGGARMSGFTCWVMLSAFYHSLLTVPSTKLGILYQIPGSLGPKIPPMFLSPSYKWETDWYEGTEHVSHLGLCGETADFKLAFLRHFSEMRHPLGAFLLPLWWCGPVSKHITRPGILSFIICSSDRLISPFSLPGM